MNKKFLALLVVPVFCGFSANAGRAIQASAQGNIGLGAGDFCLNAPSGMNCCQHTLAVGNNIQTVYNYQSDCGSFNNENQPVYFDTGSSASDKVVKGSAKPVSFKANALKK